MKNIQNVIRIGIVILFVFMFFKILDVPLAQDVLSSVRLDIVLWTILLYFFNIAIRAYRWGKIVNKDGKHVSLKDAYIVTLIGITLNIFIPATLGDLVKSYYGYKMCGVKEELLSASIIDKLFALSALFLIGSLSGFIMQQYWLCIFSAAGASVTWILISFPHFIPWRLVNSMLRFFKKSLDLQKLLMAFTLPLGFKIAMLAISVVGWLCTCIYFYILCTAFPVNVSLGYVLLIMPVLMIVRLFPFTVNALGPMEVAVVYFFGKLGIPPTSAVLISLASNIISYLIPGVVGLIFVLTIGYDKKRQYSREIS